MDTSQIESLVATRVLQLNEFEQVIIHVGVAVLWHGGVWVIVDLRYTEIELRGRRVAVVRIRGDFGPVGRQEQDRSEEHTSELQSH